MGSIYCDSPPTPGAPAEQENALEMYRKTLEKTVGLGHKLDIMFALIRVGLFYMDHDLIGKNIEKAKR